jgi:hypothetical protein
MIPLPINGEVRLRMRRRSPWIRVAEAAELLACGIQTIHNLCNEGRLEWRWLDYEGPGGKKLVLTLVNARADSNSVALANADGGPFAAFNGSGQVIGMIEPDVPDTSQVFFVSQNFQETNLFANTTPWPSLVDAHATEVAGVMVSTDATTIGVATNRPPRYYRIRVLAP